MKSITLDESLSNENKDTRKWIEKCRTFVIGIENKETGKAILRFNECGSWRCPYCRLKKSEILRKKLRYFVPKYEMNTFLTLTTKKDVKHLSKFFKVLREWTRSNLDLERFMSKNNLKNNIKSQKKAKRAIEERIKRYIKEDIEITVRIIVTPKAKLNVAKRNNIYYKRLSDKAKESFDTEYAHEIEKEIEIETDKYLKSEKRKYYYRLKNMKKKRPYPTYKKLCSNIKNRYDSIYEDKDNYKLKQIKAFWVLEFQKNGNPHYHILMNWYIPLSIIKKVTEDEEYKDSKIYHEEILKDMLNLSDLPEARSSTRIVGYLLKYLTKSIEPFYEHKRGYGGNIIHYSNGFFGERGLFKNNNKSEYKVIKKFNRLRKFKKINKKCIELESKTDVENNRHFELGENKTYQRYTQEIENCPPDVIMDIQFKITALTRLYSQESKPEFDYKHIIKQMKKKYVEKEYEYTQEQEEVIKIICTTQNMLFLNSPAGTSKTTLITNLIDTLIENNIIDCDRIGVYAYQNITVRNLSAQCKARCETLHRAGGSYLNGEFYNNEYNCIDKDLIFIDEIARLEPEFFIEKILPFIKPTTKIIVAGDVKQLKGFKIKIGETLDRLLSNSPFVDEAKLSKNYRSNKKVMKVIEKFERKEEIGSIRSFDYLIKHLKKLNKKKINYIVLTNDRKTAERVNNALLKDGKIHIGCPVICTMNYHQKEICNGDTGILIHNDEDTSTVEFNINGEHKVIEFVEEEQLDISPAYAITVHKSQGSGFDNVILFYGGGAKNGVHVNNRNSVYTGITRAKEKITVFFEDEVTKRMCYDIVL